MDGGRVEGTQLAVIDGVGKKIPVGGTAGVEVQSHLLPALPHTPQF
jgi:hypothetical protein